MEASFRSIAGWILASLLIFASQHRSEAFTWTKEPDDPTILVEGANTSRFPLEWNFNLNSGESISQITIERGRPQNSTREMIAFKTGPNGFNVEPRFENHYEATLPLTLVLLNVDNSEEYLYFVDFRYFSGRLKFAKYKVHIIVNVPPKITVVPERQSRVQVGENYTLTCNASGDPRPQILWTKEGVASKDYNVSGYKLHLVEVKRTDVGSYNCTANNGYGIATSLSVVSVKCPTNGCQTKLVGITITDEQKWPWKQAYNRIDSIEYKMLQSNLTSAIATVYTKNPEKQLYEQAIKELRSSSIVVHVQLLFGSGVNDPLQPLRDEVATGKLGPFDVDKVLVVDPTFPPSTTSPGATTTASNVTADTDARTDSGLTNAEMWGIIGGCLAFLVVIVIIILICCCCRKNKSSRGGATKSKSYSEADGYRMNKQPPSSGLGTASPAYVEARMYAPANAARRQDDQSTPNNINYTEPYFDKSSDKQPPPRYPGTEYSEMSPEKRPPSAGGGGQGEGGFELWC